MHEVARPSPHAVRPARRPFRARAALGLAWIAWIAAATSACTYTLGVFDLNDESNTYVGPPHVLVQPLSATYCPDTTCCGAFEAIPPGQPVPPEQCCGQFDLGVRGRDTLIAMRWLPGGGSGLTVLTDRVGAVAPSPDKTTPIPMCYRVSADEIPSCAAEPTSPVCETGLPPDDGILRVFFELSNTIDIWVEVQ
jgi:hypothetical protein